MQKCTYFVLVMNGMRYHCQYLLFLDVLELHDLFMFLHLVGCDAFSLSHISRVFHFNLDSFSLCSPLNVSPQCVSGPSFLQVSAFTHLSFILYHFCLIPSDSFCVSTSCFESLHVGLFISGWVWHLFGLWSWITACLIWTQLHKTDFLLPFGRQTHRQQRLLTPTVLNGLFHGYIRAMNFNDDDSHSVSDGLISHDHVTLEGVDGSVCTGQVFHYFLQIQDTPILDSWSPQLSYEY